MPKWERLAQLIEAKTGVSATWMLSSPSSTDPIIDVKGRPWNASDWLDPLAGGNGKTPDLRSLLKTSPESVVRIVVRMVETQVRMETSKGTTDFVSSVITLLHNSRAFENPVFLKNLNEAFEKETPTIMGQLWPHGDQQKVLNETMLPPALKLTSLNDLDKAVETNKLKSSESAFFPPASHPESLIAD